MSSRAESRQTPPCSACREGRDLAFDFTMAFQPIFDLRNDRVYAYEALVRGKLGQDALAVLEQVTPARRYMFDQRCRVVAIERAVSAGILHGDAKLSINFLPNAVYSPKACTQLTLRTAEANHFPTDRLIFEFTENEKIEDPDHLTHIVESYKQMGFTTALDDFGAGHSGLSLLARFQPDVVKIDMALIRGIDSSGQRKIIVEAIVALCARLDISVVAEGIETRAELDSVRSVGIDLVQGFLLARPAFEALPKMTEIAT